MSRTTLAASALFASLSLLGCDLETETIVHVVPGAAGPIRKVVTTLDVGDVTVGPGSVAGVRVSAEAQWVAERPEVTVRAEGDAVYVDSNCGEDTLCRVDIALTVPAEAALEVRGVETSIAATSLAGAATLSTVVGDVLLDWMQGPLTLNVGDGGVDGTNLGSPSVTAAVDTGDTNLEFNSGADDLELHAHMGDITLSVPPTTYHVDATVPHGRLDIGVSTASNAGRTIVAETGRGDISIQPQPIVFGRSFELQLGKSVHFADEAVTLGFLDVLEDSRCPSGAICVWAGRVVAAMSLSTVGGDAQRFELASGTAADVLGYRIELLAAQPPRRLGQPLPPDDAYILTLEVSPTPATSE